MSLSVATTSLAGASSPIFVALSLVGLAINSALMWAGTEVLGDGPLAVTVTKVVATGVVMLWNFASRKRWLEAR